MGPCRSDQRPAGPLAVVPGKLYGVRTWVLSLDDRGALRLGGHGNRQWRSHGETTWAECVVVFGQSSPKRSHREPPPAGTCSCGLYALHPWALDGSSLWGPPTPGFPASVAGVIEAWGTIQLHANGFRAQYARPAALALIGLPCDSAYGRLVTELAVSHRCELVAVTEAEALSGLCRERGWGFTEGAVRALVEPTAGDLE